MMILFRVPQPEKAPSPISLTLCGKSTHISALQFMNAYAPISAVPSGTMMCAARVSEQDTRFIFSSRFSLFSMLRGHDAAGDHPQPMLTQMAGRTVPRSLSTWPPS